MKILDVLYFKKIHYNTYHNATIVKLSNGEDPFNAIFNGLKNKKVSIQQEFDNKASTIPSKRSKYN